MTVNPGPIKGLQKCPHSFRITQPTLFQGHPMVEDHPCILEFHTAVNAKGKPIHQSEAGHTWS